MMVEKQPGEKMYEVKLPVPSDSVLIIGTGGESREQKEWAGGVATDNPILHSNGSSIRRLSGVSVSVAGQGLDGAEVSTTTPLDNVPEGAVSDRKCTRLNSSHVSISYAVLCLKEN